MQRQDRYIIRHHLQDRFATARQTIGIYQRPASDDIRRRLAANNLACLRPAKGPIFTHRHREERLRWTSYRSTELTSPTVAEHHIL